MKSGVVNSPVFSHHQETFYTLKDGVKLQVVKLWYKEKDLRERDLWNQLLAYVMGFISVQAKLPVFHLAWNRYALAEQSGPVFK